MSGTETYLEYVEPIRKELERLAKAGKTTYYKDLGDTFGKPARWSEWKKILDEISYQRPDVTIIVLNATSGWPGQIGYKRTNGAPSAEQKKFAQDELAKVFTKYCPGTPIPTLPLKRRR